MNKAAFLREEFSKNLRKLAPDAKGNWGVMNAHEMVEHMIRSFKVANGKIAVREIVTPLERLEKLQAFIMSDIPFKENTKNALMGERPDPIQHMHFEEAIQELENEINYMFEVYKAKEDLQIRNPIFGDLNFEQNVALLYKHAVHHLKQFGIEI